MQDYDNEKCSMFLLAGLGNPGDRYAETPHNVGFAAVDSIALFCRDELRHQKFDAKYGKFLLKNYNIIVMKPLTYMNLSGSPIARIADFYKVAIDKIIVFHDDIDLEIGAVKVKVNGGSGGHNGIRSIDSAIGKEYVRVRIGVGRPEDVNYSVADYVLKKMDVDKYAVLSNTIDMIVMNLVYLFEGQYGLFMNKVSSNFKL